MSHERSQRAVLRLRCSSPISVLYFHHLEPHLSSLIRQKILRIAPQYSKVERNAVDVDLGTILARCEVQCGI
jgi:hypothetical protein